MMDLEFLKGLIEAVDESGVDSVEIQRGGTQIRISKTPPAPPTSGNASTPARAYVPAPGEAESAEEGPTAGDGSGGGGAAATAEEEAGADEDLAEITSPMVGTFYRAPAPDAPAYVEVGDRVSEGETLCIIEAMKLMNELESEVAGVVEEVAVENADPVEYGQLLFRIRPD